MCTVEEEHILNKALANLDSRIEELETENEQLRSKVNNLLNGTNSTYVDVSALLEECQKENAKLKKLLMACAIGLKVHHLLLESADTSTFSSKECTGLKCTTCDLLRQIARELGSGGTPKMTSGPVQSR